MYITTQGPSYLDFTLDMVVVKVGFTDN